jgi:predicted nuclease of predicted toxin-antitoxin system
MILADEGLNYKLIVELRSAGYEVEWIRDFGAGMKDIDIIEIARKNKQIIITEDKDFGEWVFSHQITGLTVIFLRYDKEDYPVIISFLKDTLKTGEFVNTDQFITINKNKIRRRSI